MTELDCESPMYSSVFELEYIGPAFYKPHQARLDTHSHHECWGWNRSAYESDFEISKAWIELDH
jgi:hypothetical protein